MPLTDQERADFASLASGQISDAMEILGLRRSVVTGFMMLASPGAKIVGTAVTVRQVPKTADGGPRRQAHAPPGGDPQDRPRGRRRGDRQWRAARRRHLGEFHCYACKQNGAAGAVVDGATRDASDVRASGFPTFVRGLSPVKSQWDLKTAAVNEPVMLGPVPVDPGDIIFADETAVVVIPAAQKAMVLEKANEIRRSEDANRATLIARA